MKKITILLFGIFLLTYSCQNDDLCGENIPTTPQLILRFFDNTNREDLRSVNNLLAFGLDDDNMPVNLLNVNLGTSDSLAIPLRTDVDETRFLLILDSDGTPTGGNVDTLTVRYERNDVFISRACGFANNFNLMEIEIPDDGDNWILDSEIIRENVEDETSAHVQIFH